MQRRYGRWQRLDLEGERVTFTVALDRTLAWFDEHVAAQSDDMLAYVECPTGHPDAAESTLEGLEDWSGRPAIDLTRQVDTAALLNLVRD